MHILHLNHRNQILFQYLRDKKKKEKGAQKKGGENSPISPPLDPRLPSAKLRRNPYSGLPAVYPDLSTRHDWPVKKGFCFACRDRQSG